MINILNKIIRGRVNSKEQVVSMNQLKMKSQFNSTFKVWMALCCLLATTSLYAQNEPKPIPISVGYFGHFAYQPGLKIGTEFSLMGRSDTDNYSRQWFGSPQIAFFSNPGSDTNFFVNFEAGIRKQKKGKNSYTAYSAGLGYRLQSKLESFSVNLSTGDRTNKIRNSYGFLVPTLNIERGWRTHKPLSWYSKFSVGSSLFGNQNQFMLFLEVGVKFKIKKEIKPRVK